MVNNFRKNVKTVFNRISIPRNRSKKKDKVTGYTDKETVDGTNDIVISFGIMIHLTEKDEIRKSFNKIEKIRTRKGVIKTLFEQLQMYFKTTI